MKILEYSILVFGLIAKTHGLNCYHCDIYNWNGESTDSTLCLSPVSFGVRVTTSSTCAADTIGVVNYCGTQVKIVDGLVTEIHRECRSSDSDEDLNTVAVPNGDKCVTHLQNSNPSSTTTCYFHCTTDQCNTLTTASLKQCTNVCNNGGSCNYIIGECQCANGFFGPYCNSEVSIAQRKCVQCNSETDTGCASSTTSVDCPGYEEYCSTSTTYVLQGDSLIRSVITRGCTAILRAVDECSFSNIHVDPPISDTPPGYIEYTCFSTCATDGCNTNTADGLPDGDEGTTLKCVQCSDSFGHGACHPGNLPRSVCPTESTHCQSTVSYLISNRTDLSHDEVRKTYQLLEVVRECATEAVNATCYETATAVPSLKKVTCTETCQGDGCNIVWPNRPKCITCHSEPGYADGFDECLENPPLAADCTYPFEEYCVWQDMGIHKDKRKSVKGFPRRISRSCSHYNMSTGCVAEIIRNTTIETCNLTCTTDGCNVGSGTMMLQHSAAAVSMSVIIAWMAQLRSQFNLF